jgi:hypothetical protein
VPAGCRRAVWLAPRSNGPTGGRNQASDLDPCTAPAALQNALISADCRVQH